MLEGRREQVTQNKRRPRSMQCVREPAGEDVSPTCVAYVT